MKVGLVGLGKMGTQIAARLLDNSHEIVATDINQAAKDVVVNLGGECAETRQDMLAQLPEPAVVWLMIPSEVVQTEIEAWLEILPPGSILIDGGNSDFRLTRKRAALCLNKGVQLVDIGTSGGIMGFEKGFSMMIGGDTAAYMIVEPIIKSLAQPDGYHHFGPAGAGHFVKMVHNAIEYGMMESYAEGYRLLREGPYNNLDLAAAGEVWQHGSIISSDLNGLAVEALQENPLLENIEGYVAESGEARWALEVAKEASVDMPSIQASFDVRRASQNGQANFSTKLLAALRNKFGGHSIHKNET